MDKIREMHLNLKRLGISAKAFMDGLKYRQYLTVHFLLFISVYEWTKLLHFTLFKIILVL